MISLLNSLSELEKCHQGRELALDCYLTAIRNIALYAVELEPKTIALHRRHLEDLAAEVSAGNADVLTESRATVRALLREHRDHTARYLARLLQELADSAGALERTLEALSQTDGDHGMQLRLAIAKLRAISPNASPVAVREAVLAAASTIETSLEEVRIQHQITVAQFVTEIQMLHKRIDGLETAASIDKLTQLFNREQMEARIRSLHAEKMSILLLKAGGLSAAETQFGRDVADELTGAFTKRLRNSLPPDAVIGRWCEELFMVMLPADKPEATALAARISESLAGTYACLKAGKTVRPAIHLRIGVADPKADSVEGVLHWVSAFLKAG